MTCNRLVYMLFVMHQLRELARQAYQFGSQCVSVSVYTMQIDFMQILLSGLLKKHTKKCTNFLFYTK